MLVIMASDLLLSSKQVIAQSNQADGDQIVKK